MRRTRRVFAPAPVLASLGVPRRQVLAAAGAHDGTWLVATATALHLAPPDAAPGTLPWHEVDLADWQRDEDRLTIVPADRSADALSFELDDPRDLLTVVRERVQSTVVLERHARTDQGRVSVVCRRRVDRRGLDADELVWHVRLPQGADADDPAYAGARRVAARLLHDARADLGL